MIARDSAIIPMTPAADHRGLEGFFVNSGGADGKTASVVTNATTQFPVGVITEGFAAAGPAKDSVATPAFHGTVKVKVGAAPGAIICGTYLTLKADGTVQADQGPGTARTRVARALEPGVAGELIEAYLVEPVGLT